MALPLYQGDPEVISKLATYARDRGLTGPEMQAKFDEGLKTFVEWFNDVFLKHLHRPVPIINGNFMYPVNQHGRTSGAEFSTADSYFMDMWKLVSGSVIWTAGAGFSLNGVLKQYIEVVPTDLYNETLPVNINVGGFDYARLLTFPYDVEETDSETAGAVTITVGYEEKNSVLCETAVTHVPYISLATSSAATIRYIYSLMPSRSYPEQLNLCHRYLWRTHAGGGMVYLPAFSPVDTETIRFNIYFPTTMRTTPEITINSIRDTATGGAVTFSSFYPARTPSALEAFYAIVSAPHLDTNRRYQFDFSFSAEM